MRNFLPILFVVLLTALPVTAEMLPGEMPLTSAFAEKLVTAGLADRGHGDGFRVTIDRPRLPLGNQDARPTRIVLDGLRHDAGSGRFKAVMIGTVEGEPRFTLPIEGRVQELVEIAVLARPVRRGETISPSDLDWQKVAPDALSESSLIDDAQLIGAEARRRLSPGRILTSRDIGPPMLVRRGQSVRIVYARGGLTLTALGTAREDGAFGERVRVVNPDSRMEILGTATGPQEVTVGAAIVANTGS